MKEISIFADKNLIISEINPNIYSSFIEHLGRSVYEGIYEPSHPTSDENGFRNDVISLVKELNIRNVRYPGGNFLSGYNWQNGIGPKNQRKTMLDLAWHSIETNEFGTDEFMKWCELTNIKPIMGVNLGTGTPKEASELVEYCNFSNGSYYSDLRIANGHQEPYKVKNWCLGNEMDGDWQICHLNAEDYAKKALETAKMMKWVDNNISLVACGSSGATMPTFPEWDRIVMESLYNYVDYLSVHQYYFFEGNEEDYFSSYKKMDNYIHVLKSTLEYVKAKIRSNKNIYISFDEWNIWYQNKPMTNPWIKGPHLAEDIYSMRDALVFGGLLNTLVNNCDIVKFACLAQLVNVIAPIMTEKDGKAIRQTTFYPFMYVSNNALGNCLKTISYGDTFSSKNGEVSYVSNSITYDDEYINVFLVNYSKEETKVNITLNSFNGLKTNEFITLSSNNLDDTNTFDNEFNVVPVKQKVLPEIVNNKLDLKLKPLSWNMIKIKHK